MELLSEFDFEIKHIKGKENIFVDALSMKNQVSHIITINTWKLDLKRIFLNALCADGYYLHNTKYLQRNVLPKYMDYSLDEDEILITVMD